jgi:hypothetical protein
METQEKECAACSRLLPLGQFYRRSDTKNSYVSICKECFNRRSNERYMAKRQATSNSAETRSSSSKLAWKTRIDNASAKGRPITRKGEQCSVQDCDKPTVARGLCSTHYYRLRNHGSQYVGRPRVRRDDIRHMYVSYKEMVYRCHNKNHKNYPANDAKGITVCDRWRESFSNFVADMGKRPTGMYLRRIDNTKGFSPDNCVWSSPKKYAPEEAAGDFSDPLPFHIQGIGR